MMAQPDQTRRPSRTAVELLAVSLAFLLPVAFSPNVASYFWMPKAAGSLLFVGIGIPLVVGLLSSDLRRPALLALGFVAIELLSALISGDRTNSFFGTFAASDGVLFWAAAVGAWGVGATVAGRADGDVRRALLAGCAINAAVAIAETVANLSQYHLEIFQGRAPGLMGNPIHLSALLAGGLGLLGRSAGSRPRSTLPLLVLFGAGLQVAGGRAGLAAGLVVLGVGLYGGKWIVATAAVGAVALGLVVGAGANHVGGTPSASTRLTTEPSTGIVDRTENWKEALGALTDRPIVGWGPNRYRAATGQRRSRLLASHGPDRMFEDAHNVVFELLVTVGLAGVLAFLGFLAAAALSLRGLRTPLVLFAAAVLANHLLEPGLAGTTPLAFLALGCASRGHTTIKRSVAIAAATLGIGASIAAVVLLSGGFELEQARLDYSVGAIHRANDLLPRWSNTAGLEARIHLFYGRFRHDPSELDQSVSFRREAVRRDPTNPSLWNDLGDVLVGVGRGTEARRAYLNALPHNPWSVRALANVAFIDVSEGRNKEAIPFVEKALEVEDNARLRALLRAAREGGGYVPPPSG